MQNCLLCGHGVWYVGLFNADCTNSACTNYREPTPKPESTEYGTWAWAEDLQARGWQLEYREPTSFKRWYRLDVVLVKTSFSQPKTDFEFRLHQNHYAPRSEYRQGTEAWAADVGSKGYRVRQRGDEFEIIP
jgi:hypothetical protein